MNLWSWLHYFCFEPSRPSLWLLLYSICRKTLKGCLCFFAFKSQSFLFISVNINKIPTRTLFRIFLKINTESIKNTSQLKLKLENKGNKKLIILFTKSHVRLCLTVVCKVFFSFQNYEWCLDIWVRGSPDIKL